MKNGVLNLFERAVGPPSRCPRIGKTMLSGVSYVTDVSSMLKSVMCLTFQVCQWFLMCLQGAAYVLVQLSEPVQSLKVVSQKFCFKLKSRFLSKLFMIAKYIF